MDLELASAAWLYIGGADIAPRCVALNSDVRPLWCLLLANAEVVPAITPPQEEMQTPQSGLRVNAEVALANWQLFCDFIQQHPQQYRVPALGTYLAAVADYLRHVADELGQGLSELWLQGDLDAVSGPFDANVESRIAFWKWNADSRLEELQAGTDDLHDITLVLDFEDLDEWVRTFGLDSLDHPYFSALGNLDEFEEDGTSFAAFHEQEEEEEPVDPWRGHNYRAITAAGKTGMVASDSEDDAWHVPPQWDEIRPDLYSFVRVWVRRAERWGLLRIEPTAELLFDAQFDAVVDSAAGDLVVVCKDGAYGVLDIDERTWRVPAVHEELRQESRSLFRLRQGDLYGYLDEHGAVVVPPRYEQTHPFGGYGLFDAPGVAWVAQGGLWGLIDTTGRELQPCRFSRVEYREEHDHRGWRVWQEARQGWVSANGELSIACEWDEVDCFDRYADAYEAEGIFRVSLNGKQGLLPTEGDWRIPCQYDEIEPLGVGPGAPPLPADRWRMYPGPEEGSAAAYIAGGNSEQSRLLIRVTNEQGTGVIDEAERQVVPMADWSIETIGNDNLHWLSVCEAEERCQLWSVLKREPALPGWHAGVSALALPNQPPLMLTFERLPQEYQRYSLQWWWGAEQPAIAGRFLGLSDQDEFFTPYLGNSEREALIEAWGKNEAVFARELLADGSVRLVFIRPGQPAIDAMDEWARRYQQGDLGAALARARATADVAQAYLWAQRACALDQAKATPSDAAWVYLVQLVLQGAGGAEAMAKARQWVDQGIAVEESSIGEGYQLLLLLGRVWLEPAAGPIDADKAFKALTRLNMLSGRNQREHIESLYLLGQCWRDGLGCIVDLDKARNLWRAAASDGHGPATQALVELLAGEAEQQTEPEAAGRLWMEALNHAQVYLSMFAADGASDVARQMHYFCGETLLREETTDWRAAEEYLKTAAEAGHTDAMGLLAAGIYRNRASSLRSLRNAVQWAWRYAEATGVIKSATSGWLRWVFAAFWLLRRG